MDIRHCYVPNLPGIKNIEVEKEVVSEEVSVSGEIVVSDEKKVSSGEKEAVNDIEKIVNGEKETENDGREVEKEVVIMAKHLCGVATDLALRSLQAFRIRKSDQNGEIIENGKDFFVSMRGNYRFICCFFYFVLF